MKEELKEFKELLKTKKDVEKLKNYLEKCREFIRLRDWNYYKYYKVLKKHIRKLLRLQEGQSIVITDINTNTLQALVIVYMNLLNISALINSIYMVDLEKEEIKEITDILDILTKDDDIDFARLIKKTTFERLIKTI